MAKRSIPPETKAEVIAAVLRGERQRAVALKYGIATSTLTRWMQAYRRGETGLNVLGRGVVAGELGNEPGMAAVIPLRPQRVIVGRALAADGPTPEQAAALLEAAALSPRDSTIAQCAGVSLEMLRKWLDLGHRDPSSPLGEFVTELKRVAASARTEMLGIVRSAAQRGDWKAAAWIVEKTEFSDSTSTTLAGDPNAGLANMLAQLAAKPDDADEDAG